MIEEPNVKEIYHLNILCIRLNKITLSNLNFYKEIHFIYMIYKIFFVQNFIY
jgi:hypothetical protein